MKGITDWLNDLEGISLLLFLAGGGLILYLIYKKFSANQTPSASNPYGSGINASGNSVFTGHDALFYATLGMFGTGGLLTGAMSGATGDSGDTTGA
jgi:hypothetical protein